jgi:hypothetical protein
MTDIDMFAHMQNVFSPIDRDKPNLPFSEFIVDAGEHRVTRGTEFTKYGRHYYAQYEIPRKDGKLIHVSVISGNMFYCRPDAPYEVRVIGMNDDEPRGYQTDEDLMILLAKLVAQGDTDGI